jgi:hypothetical protein
MNAHVCLFPLSLVGAVYWSELGSYVRGQNQYFEGKKAPKINRQATGLFLFDVLLFYSVLALHTDDHDAS